MARIKSGPTIKRMQRNLPPPQFLPHMHGHRDRTPEQHFLVVHDAQQLRRRGRRPLPDPARVDVALPSLIRDTRRERRLVGERGVGQSAQRNLQSIFT